MAEKKIRSDDPEQSKAFIEKAREIGADDRRTDITDKLMGQMAKMKPGPKSGAKDGKERKQRRD